mgnify:CR=1 FL=1
MIFRYAMRSRFDIELYDNRRGELSRSGNSTRPPKSLPRFLGLSLPRVCRQIYSETATMVFRENTFSFATRKALDLWLARRLPAQREAIIRLELLQYDEEGRAKVANELKKKLCPNLRSISQDELGAVFIADMRWRRRDWECSDVSTDDDPWEEWD